MSRLKYLFIFLFVSVFPSQDTLYYEAYSFESEITKQLLQSVDFTKCKNILEIGSKEGAVSAFLAQNLPDKKIVGLENSKSLVQNAQKKFHRYSNLIFEQNIFEYLKKDNCFDCILCCNAYPLFLKAEKIFKTLHSSLTPTGMIYLLIQPNNSPYMHLFFELLHSSSWKEYKQDLPAEKKLEISDYKNILKNPYLEIIKFSVEPITIYFGTIEDFRSYVRSWIYTYLPVHRTLRDKFIEEFIYKLKENNLCTIEGKILLPHKKIHVVLRKSLIKK